MYAKVGMDVCLNPRIKKEHTRKKIIFRSGPWNGFWFGGINALPTKCAVTVNYNSTSAYYTFVNIESTLISRLVLKDSGIFKLLTWNPRRGEWAETLALRPVQCDEYSYCGPNGFCKTDRTPVCECPTGFVPKVAQNWQQMDWSDGCVHKTPLNCSMKVGFKEFSTLKLPDKSRLLANNTTAMSTPLGCKNACLQDCSCMAFAKLEIGCLVWSGELLDISEYDDDDDEKGHVLYIKMAASDIGDTDRRSNKDIPVTVAIIFMSLICVLVTVTFIGYIFWKGTSWMREECRENFPIPENNPDGEEENLDQLPLFDWHTIVLATDDFSHENKIGEDQTKGPSIDWQKRFNIIVGIARGLLYLHRDSRLGIIHRDLKASNILLNDEMTPKISDFGLARTFGDDQLEASTKTKRIMGTYGYMSPEYAIDGLFSIKSDVFSFGVLVLEIVSGRKNRGFHHPDHDLTILGHAWRLWIEGKPMELMDASMEEPVTTEILRCINVGLLCVQHRREDRPTMATVVLMLDTENPSLPQPKQPGFYTERDFNEATSTLSTWRNSTNQVTITNLEGR
ncbi:hypothetical protein Tsubulata_037969 [Turnera subulata]|uniref:non-specific serine/threonine protein kinase n=1 Tax=Turnera subulata TaxID=218843 RepID=A0A9Q0JHL2_9ROSI|nr:hypothetical protein Tsubulata_037969 [Turnera subulata]